MAPSLVAVAGLFGLGCPAITEATVDAGGRSFNDGGTITSCLDLANEVGTELAMEFAGPCDADNDCAVDPGNFVCPGGTTFDTTEVAYAVSREAEFRETEARLYGFLCEEDCGQFHLDTFITYAYCRDGACEGTYRDPEEYCPRLLERQVEATRRTDFTEGCVAPSDCVLVDSSFACIETGASFEACPVAVLASQEPSLGAALETFRETSCADHGFVCNVQAEPCPAVQPDCQVGRCVEAEIDINDGGAKSR